MNRPTLVVAAKILVYINGKLFGRCTSFSWQSTTPRKKIRTIDVQHPVELAATTVDVSWSMGVLRTHGDGGLQGVGIAPVMTELSLEKYFTIQLYDRVTGLTIFRSDMNNTDVESWNITAKGLMQGQAQGSGIVWVNEAAR